MVFCVLLLVGGLPTQRSEDPLIVQNVKKALQFFDLQGIEAFGVNKRGDKVVAQVGSEVGFLGEIKSHPRFARDLAPHKGSLGGFRSLTVPSLQVTVYPDRVEMDLDRWPAVWPRLWLSALKHGVLEVGWHKCQRHVLLYKTAMTNQRRMAKRVEKSFFPTASKKY